MDNVLIYLKSFFSGNTRTIKVKQNILVSFLVKCCSIFISLLLVPLTLNYLNSYEYGIWLTLSSILIWVNYFDMGLANGLRNKLAEALAIGDIQKGRIYVSTTFFLLFAIISIVLLGFFLLQGFINWNQILNVDSQINLNSVIIVVFTFFCLTFVFKFIGNIFLAAQLSAVNDFLIFLGNLLALIIIIIMKSMIPGSLYNIAFVYSLSPVIVYLLAYPFTFYIKYPNLRPTIYLVKIKYAKDLLGLGLQFFIIQIGCLILFATANVMISQMFGPDQVTIYNLSYKYFSVLTMAFSIVISPLWSAITEAYVRKDFKWIQMVMKRMMSIWLVSIIVGVFMLLFSGIVYRIWVGSEIAIPFSLSIVVLIYVSLNAWTGMFASFVNGVGKLRIQLYCTIFSSLFFIPVAIIMGKLLGVGGVCIAMSIALVPYAILLPLQYKKLLSKSLRGVWNK